MSPLDSTLAPEQLGLLLALSLTLPAHGAVEPAPHAVRHCSAQVGLSRVEGQPGQFLLQTARGSLGARWPSAQPAEGAPALHVIRALDDSWDADHNPETVTDTLVVPLGSTVRWQLVSGLHTLTSGSGPADPAAGKRFDYLLDPQHAIFDSTFRAADTLQFFCYFHQPRMRGVLIISANASVPDAPTPPRVRFTGPPRPNPSRGSVSFDVGVPREQPVRVEVLDVDGRRVALLHQGPLAAGEHSFRWRGSSDRGVPARSGVYVIHLASDNVVATRRVSLLR